METEAKFIVPDDSTFAQLREVEALGPYSLRDRRTKLVHDRYVDTQDRSFFSRKLFVRLREASDGLLLTMKGLGAGVQEGNIHRREEYEARVPSLDVSSWPQSDVRRLAEETVDGKSLNDLFTLDQVRTVSHLYQGDRPVAEVSLDEVTIHTGAEPVRAYELEIELIGDGLVSDLRILTRLLTDEYRLLPQPMSKFERAMMLTMWTPGGSNAAGRSEEESTMTTNSEHANGGEPQAQEQHPQAEPVPAMQLPWEQPLAADMVEHVAIEPESDNGTTQTAPEQPSDGPQQARVEGSGASTLKLSAADAPDIAGAKPNGTGVQPTDSAAVAARKIIGAHFQKMLQHHEGTRKGEDTEALHDMRVATRRMRAVFRVFNGYLEGGEADEVRKGLRTVARALGGVRDLDVLIEDASEFRDNLPADRRSSMDGLLEAWQTDRDKARKKMLKVLDSKDYSRLVKHIERFLAEEPEERHSHIEDDTEEIEPYQVRHLAASGVWDKYEEVRAYETIMDAPALEQLHGLRIAGKYLRYTLECFREVLPSGVDDLIRDVTQMQDQLGSMHDAHVASGLIRRYIKQSARKGKKSKQGRKHTATANNTENGTEQPDGLTTYLDEREAAIRDLTSQFGPTWEKLNSRDWRMKLATVVAEL